MTRQFTPPAFDCHNNSCQFSASLCYFLTLGAKRIPQYPVVERLQSVLLLPYYKTKFHTHINQQEEL
jgi:hypothetical protein